MQEFEVTVLTNVSRTWNGGNETVAAGMVEAGENWEAAGSEALSLKLS